MVLNSCVSTDVTGSKTRRNIVYLNLLGTRHIDWLRFHSGKLSMLHDMGCLKCLQLLASTTTCKSMELGKHEEEQYPYYAHHGSLGFCWIQKMRHKVHIPHVGSPEMPRAGSSHSGWIWSQRKQWNPEKMRREIGVTIFSFFDELGCREKQGSKHDLAMPCSSTCNPDARRCSFLEAGRCMQVSVAFISWASFRKGNEPLTTRRSWGWKRAFPSSHCRVETPTGFEVTLHIKVLGAKWKVYRVLAGAPHIITTLVIGTSFPAWFSHRTCGVAGIGSIGPDWLEIWIIVLLSCRCAAIINLLFFLSSLLRHFLKFLPPVLDYEVVKTSTSSLTSQTTTEHGITTPRGSCASGCCHSTRSPRAVCQWLCNGSM